jgi:hypothetical protein
MARGWWYTVGREGGRASVYTASSQSLAGATRGNATHSDSFGVKLITSSVNYVTFISTLHLPRNL